MKSRLFVCSAAFVLLGCGFRHGDRVLIPDGYVGWVEIRYNVKGAPPTPLVDGMYELRLGADGTFATSSDHSTGYGAEEYFYVLQNGKMRKLQGGIMAQEPDDLVHTWVSSGRTGSDGRTVGPVVRFFVGPRNALTPMPEVSTQ